MIAEAFQANSFCWQEFIRAKKIQGTGGNSAAI
jgi:hypothetical protein